MAVELNKDEKMLLLIGGVLLLIIAFLGVSYYKIHFTDCKPCGYIDYKNEVEPGYLVEGRYANTCFSCSFAAEHIDSELRNPEQRLAPCPKKYWILYNENVEKVNKKFVEMGYEPKFKPVEIKNEKNN